MGTKKFNLARQMDTLEVADGWCPDGQPAWAKSALHLLSDDVDAITGPLLAPAIEHHALYPRTHQRADRANCPAPIHTACACWTGCGHYLAVRLPHSCGDGGLQRLARGPTGRAVRIDLDGSAPCTIDCAKRWASWMTGPVGPCIQRRADPFFLGKP